MNEFKREAQHVWSQKTKRQKVQTYDEDYIKLGFIECPSDVTKPQCLVYLQNIVKWRYETNQVEVAFADSTSWGNGSPRIFSKEERILKQKKAHIRSLVSKKINKSVLFSGAKKPRKPTQLPKSQFFQQQLTCAKQF